MKKIYVLIVFIFARSILFASTDVSGIISSSTTWTINNSPYIVTGNVLLTSTLTINSGVVVKFDGYYYFDIEGKLIAQGTKLDQILITSNNNESIGAWSHIKFKSTSDADSVVEYVRVEYADEVAFSGPVKSIQNNMFWNCGQVLLSEYVPGFSKNFIMGDKTSSEKALNCASNESKVSNNFIYNHLKGIEGGGNSNNCYISSNTVISCDEGIYVSGSTDVVHYIISNNNIVDSITYHARNFGSADLNCVNNYWAETDTNTIALKIYDYYDDFNLGEIIFNPIANSEFENTRPVLIQKPYVTNNSTNNYIKGNELNFTWEEALDDGTVLSYNIYLSSNSDSYFLDSNEITNSYAFTADEGVAYKLKIGAIDTVGEGWISDESNTFIIDASKPSAISDLATSVSGSGGVSLSWTVAVDTISSVSHYSIYKSTIQGLLGDKISTDYTITAGAYSDNDTLINGVTYYYTVQAIDLVGNIQNSGNNQASMHYYDNIAPTSVNDLSAQMINNDYVSLSWSVSIDTFSGLNYYSIYRSESSGSLGNKITSDGSIATNSYSDTSSLINGTTYYYTVYPVDLAGNIQTAGNNQVSVVYNKSKLSSSDDNLITESDGIQVNIPANTLNNSTSLLITRPEAASLPKAVSDNSVRGSSVIVELKLSDGTTSLNNEITITVPYTAAAVSGLEESNLKLFYLDEIVKKWVMIENSTVDTANKAVRCSINHLTIFRIMEYRLPDTAIEELTNYPNPFRAGLENTVISYSLRETKDVEIYIYDLLGDLVHEDTLSAGGTGARAGINEFNWDGKNDMGKYVDVGAYILRLKCNGKDIIRRIGVK